MGIDGIAILVNEHLVMSKQEIDFFKSSLRRLDVQFFFIQSKTSAKFSENREHSVWEKHVKRLNDGESKNT